LISISTFASTNDNNIRAFIKSGNNAIIKHVHTFVARLVVNCKALLSLAIDVDLNKVIQATSYLKSRSYILMMFGKMNRTLISMFAKFTVCINALIVKVCAMYMSIGYNKLANEDAGSSCG